MAQTRLPGSGMFWPKYTPHTVLMRSVPALGNPTALGALNAAYHIVGHIEWADGGSHDASIIHFRTGSSSLVGTLRVSLQDASTTAGPPGRGDGTPDQSATQANPTGSTNYSLTLSANRTLAHGARIACVFDISAYTSGTMSIAGIAQTGASDYPGLPTFTLFDGTATYTAQSVAPIITFEAADGTFGQFVDGYPRLSAAINTHAINTGTTPDEVALEFTVSAPLTCGGASVYVLPAASGDYDVVLYAGTTAERTVSIVTDTLNVDAAARWVTVTWADYALATGTTYRLVVKPTTANNVSCYSMDCSASGHLRAFAGAVGFTSRTDAGAFAAVTATRLPFMRLLIVGVDDAAGSGGGTDTALPTFRV